jgi:hypothetical protein
MAPSKTEHDRQVAENKLHTKRHETIAALLSGILQAQVAERKLAMARLEIAIQELAILRDIRTQLAEADKFRVQHFENYFPTPRVTRGGVE